MRRYETICITKPNLSENDITAVVDRSTAIIEQDGGSILNIDRWGLKKLTYLINKESQGYYVLSEYLGTPQAVNEIERIYRIDDRVMKYLTVKLDDDYDPEVAAAKAAAKAERLRKKAEHQAQENESDD